MNERHDHHHILSIFIILFVLALLAIVGLFAYDVFFDGNARTVKRIELNEDAIDQGFVEQLTLISESVPETVANINEPQATTTKTITSSPIRPSFDYPADWHVFMSSTINEPSIIHRAYLDEEPIQPNNLSEQVPSIIIETRDISSEIHETTWSDAFIATLTSPNIQIIPVDTLENPVYLIQTSAEANFAYLIYDNGVSAIIATFIDVEANQSDNEAWNIVSNSMTFTNLQ